MNKTLLVLLGVGVAAYYLYTTSKTPTAQGITYGVSTSTNSGAANKVVNQFYTNLQSDLNTIHSRSSTPAQRRLATTQAISLEHIIRALQTEYR